MFAFRFSPGLGDSQLINVALQDLTLMLWCYLEGVVLGTPAVSNRSDPLLSHVD